MTRLSLKASPALCNGLFSVQPSHISLYLLTIVASSGEEGRQKMDSLVTFCRTRPGTKGNDSGSGTNPPAQYQPRSLSSSHYPGFLLGTSRRGGCPGAQSVSGLGLGWQSPAGQDPATSVLPTREELLKRCHLHSPPHASVTFTQYPSLFSTVV